MRKEGYYLVKFQGYKYVARHFAGVWSLPGNVNTYQDEDFEFIDDYCLFLI